MKIKCYESPFFHYFIFFLCFARQTKQRISTLLLFFLFLFLFSITVYFPLSSQSQKEGQKELLSANSDATAISFSEAFHMAPANNPMDNMAASLRPKTELQPMPSLKSTEKYHQNKKKLNLILICQNLKKKFKKNLQIHSL